MVAGYTFLDLIAVLPVAGVALVGLLMLLWDLYFRKHGIIWPMFACFVGIALTWPQRYLSEMALKDLVYIDGFSFVLNIIIFGGAALTFLLNHRQLEGQKIEANADVDILILLAAIGGVVMVSAANLVLLFLGFELLSVCVYVMTGLARKEKASSEGALKYFILGAFSSAFLLYGMVLVYGATGSMALAEIAANASSDNAMLLVGLGLMIFGFGFKVSLVPFHFWTPDVYQGAPSAISGFMAVVVKAAAFGSFLRVMHISFGELSEVWQEMLWVLCVITMTVGNFAALRQKSIKRMLAYSSVAHAGYALIGFIVFGSSSGGAATLFYLVVYSLMTIAAFGVVLLITSGSEAQYAADDAESLSGVGWSHPFLGVVMVIALLSLAGMPPFAGFVGKFYLFRAAVSGGYVGLAIIAALNSVVSLYYYLRVIVVMYFAEERSVEWTPREGVSFAPGLALSLATIGTIGLGIFSQPCLHLVQTAVESLG